MYRSSESRGRRLAAAQLDATRSLSRSAGHRLLNGARCPSGRTMLYITTTTRRKIIRRALYRRAFAKSFAEQRRTATVVGTSHESTVAGGCGSQGSAQYRRWPSDERGPSVGHVLCTRLSGSVAARRCDTERFAEHVEDRIAAGGSATPRADRDPLLGDPRRPSGAHPGAPPR